MRCLLCLTVCLLPAFSSAAIGDPCDENGECTPGLVCSTDEDGTMYCTGRCPAEGCPDGFFCRDSMGVHVCERGLPPEPVGFGEECGDDACEEGLFCAEDGDEQYCTRRCLGAGSCPQGWSCTVGGNCKRRNGPANYTDLCDDAEPRCAEGLECHEFPNLGALCTQACEDEGGECGRDFVCDGTRCAPLGQARVGIGGQCNPADDDSCEDGLRCYVAGDDAYCTGPCNMAGQCPAGFGCVDQGSLMGECRRGEPDSEVFNEGDTVDPNDIPDEPPPMPRNDMGSGEDGNEVDEGCDCRQADGASWLALLLIAGLRRRRGGLESPPNTGR